MYPMIKRTIGKVDKIIVVSISFIYRDDTSDTINTKKTIENKKY